MCQALCHGSLWNFNADEPKQFDLKVRPSNMFPIDLYLLMDLSYSMRDDLENLKSLGTELCEGMKIEMHLLKFEMYFVFYLTISQ